jgi:hypothetical protein
MKELTACLAVALALAGCPALAQVRPGHYGRLSPEQQVRWSEEEAFRASARKDSVRLKELLHDNYFRLLSDGRKLKKPSIQRWVEPDPPGFAPDTPANLRVTLASPTTAITTFDDLRRTTAGDTLRIQHASNVWVKEQGRWQLYAVTFRNEQAGAAVRAIRQGAARRNQAYAAHDSAAFGALLAPDFQLTSGAGSRAGRRANVLGFQLLQQRPGLSFSCTPETVTAGNGFGSEAGTWTEQWSGPAGFVQLSGTYLAQWVLTANGRSWQLRALLLVPTACKGRCE